MNDFLHSNKEYLKKQFANLTIEPLKVQNDVTVVLVQVLYCHCISLLLGFVFCLSKIRLLLEF